MTAADRISKHKWNMDAYWKWLPSSFLCIFPQPWPEINLTVGNFPPLAFNMFSSLWLLTLGIFQRALTPSLLPALHTSVCQSKGQSPDGSLYHKEKHKRSSTVSRLTGKWDFRRDRDKTWNYQHRESMFSRGHPLSKKRKMEDCSKAWPRDQNGLKLDLTILHCMRYCYLTLSEHVLCLPSAYISVGKAKHLNLTRLYCPFSIRLNRFSMVLLVKEDSILYISQ